MYVGEIIVRWVFCFIFRILDSCFNAVFFLKKKEKIPTDEIPPGKTGRKKNLSGISGRHQFGGTEGSGVSVALLGRRLARPNEAECRDGGCRGGGYWWASSGSSALCVPALPPDTVSCLRLRLPSRGAAGVKDEQQWWEEEE